MGNKKTTKNARGAGTIRKRADGRWEGRYSVGFDPKTGKQIQKSVYGATQKEARQKLTQIIGEIDEGEYLEPSKLKLGDWLDIWLNEYCEDKKYSTVKGYRAKVKKHIKPQLGDIPLGKLTTPEVQKFYNRLLKPPDGSLGSSPKTIKNTHGVLSKAMSVAVVNGYIRRNPCQGVILPRMEKREVEPLTDDQVALLLQLGEKDEEYGILLKVILLTGLRKAEALGITWDCVDFRRGVIRINKQLQKRPLKDGGVMFTSLKNGKGRVLKPAPYVMELMKKRYEQQIRQKEEAPLPGSGGIRKRNTEQRWHSPQSSVRRCSPRPLIIISRSSLSKSARRTQGSMIFGTPMRFCPCRTEMMSKPCRGTLATRQRPLPWMFTGTSPKR